jgi:exopolysaccharide biosynthesis polyprenyl glycosylphosphotransferase
VVEILAERRPVSTRIAARTSTSVRPVWESRYVWLLVALYLFAAIASTAAAYTLRFGGTRGPHLPALWLTATLPVGWILILALNRAYDTRHLFVGSDEYQRVFRAGCTFMASVAVALYALNVQVARGYVLIALPLGCAVVGMLRFMLRRGLHHSWANGYRLRRVVAVGHAADVAELCHMLRRSRFHGLDVVGACLPDPSSRLNSQVPVPVYGSFDSVNHAALLAEADTVIVLTCPEINGPALRRIGWSVEDDKVDLIVASALMDVAGGRTTIRPVDGLPMLHVDHATLRGPRRIVKEALDRLLGVLLLLMFSPVLLALGACVRLTSNGPALFRQVRIGRDGREFHMVKFRTMYPGSERMVGMLASSNENDGLLFKIKDDPRVTPIGRILRRYSLDELPQLFNVVSGSMSLVGPRPPLRSEVDRYPDDFRRRLVVKPGMTGLWQVSGRSDLPWDEVMRLDLHYVDNWSLSLDLVILMRTVTAVVRSSGAY